MTRPESAPGFTLWLTGLSGFTEEPVAPDLELDTELQEPEARADQVITFLESRGLVQ